MKIVVMCGDDKIAEVGRRYPRGQVVKICRWDDGGLGTDDCFYLLQQEVAAEIVEVKVEGYF